MVASLSRRESLFGLAERIVGVESCVYLAAQLADLQPHLLAGEEPGSHALLAPEAAEMVRELRRPVYFTSVVKGLQLEPALGLMAKVDYVGAIFPLNCVTVPYMVPRYLGINWIVSRDLSTF